MTSPDNDLVERVARAIEPDICSEAGCENCEPFYACARAAIAMVLEEAARVNDELARQVGKPWSEGLRNAANQIRALNPKER